MGHADGLSRLPDPEGPGQNTWLAAVQNTTPIQAYRAKDEATLSRLLGGKIKLRELKVVNDILKKGEKTVLTVEELVEQAKMYHSHPAGAAHGGAEKLRALLEKSFYNPRIAVVVREVTESCIECQRTSDHQLRGRAPLHLTSALSGVLSP